MFRKPKRKAATNVRPRETVDDEDDPLSAQDSADQAVEVSTSTLIEDARKRVAQQSSSSAIVTATTIHSKEAGDTRENILHTYKVNNLDSAETTKNKRNLVTSIAEHHPDNIKSTTTDGKVGIGEDGIFRNQQRNKFLAGPIKAATNVRVTARFDYQPDICKDYKETGFCGYGDSCIYLHDRGDTLSGWQLEKQWEEQQKVKKLKQEKEMNTFFLSASGQQNEITNSLDEEQVDLINTDDGIPFACFICRQPFHNPVVTKCNHYFCESCIMNHVRNSTDSCPLCGTDTNSVFNEPTKLLAKKRKILGSKKAQENDSWTTYAAVLQGKPISI